MDRVMSLTKYLENPPKRVRSGPFTTFFELDDTQIVQTA
jgi:hypothetical protein